MLMPEVISGLSMTLTINAGLVVAAKETRMVTYRCLRAPDFDFFAISLLLIQYIVPNLLSTEPRVTEDGQYGRTLTELRTFLSVPDHYRIYRILYISLPTPIVWMRLELCCIGVCLG